MAIIPLKRCDMILIVALHGRIGGRHPIKVKLKAHKQERIKLSDRWIANFDRNQFNTAEWFMIQLNYSIYAYLITGWLMSWPYGPIGFDLVWCVPNPIKYGHENVIFYRTTESERANARTSYTLGHSVPNITLRIKDQLTSGDDRTDQTVKSRKGTTGWEY